MFCTVFIVFFSHFANSSFLSSSSFATFTFASIYFSFLCYLYSNLFSIFLYFSFHIYFLNPSTSYNSSMTKDRILHFYLPGSNNYELWRNEILNHFDGAGIVSYSCRKFLSSCKNLLLCRCSLQETETLFLKVKQSTIWCRNVQIVCRSLMSPGLVWL